MNWLQPGIQLPATLRVVAAVAHQPKISRCQPNDVCPTRSKQQASENIVFNLVGLQCQSFQTNTAWLTTNAQDTRALLCSESSYQHEGSDTGSMSQSFYVATVPEASSWAMLLAGVGLVGWAARRRMA